MSSIFGILIQGKATTPVMIVAINESVIDQYTTRIGHVGSHVIVLTKAKSSVYKITITHPFPYHLLCS